ncbi:MAG: hypothetical protein E7404_00020 [Ruminococcaceae bacterium]|nr:hypothetical protein [Oscillospiraceae bacterium]
MNQKMRNLLIYTTAFFFTITFLYLLLFLSALIPNELITPNMQKSAEIYKTREAFEFNEKNVLNSVGDNYADSILLGISYNMGRGNPFVSTINTRYHKGDSIGENYGFYITVTENAKPDTDYTRYFHGSAMIVRVLHILGDVNLVKNINFVIILLLIFLTIIILCRRKYYDIVLALILSLLMVKFYNIRLSIEYQSTFLICFIMCPLYILFEKKSDVYIISLSVIGGVATAFFDFLTTETITILLPLMLIVSIRAKEERLFSYKEVFLFLIKCLVAWGIAYVGTFLLKWTVASLVTGNNEFSLALSSVAERFGGKVLLKEKPKTIFSSVMANFSMLVKSAKREYSNKALICVLSFLMIIFSVWYLTKSKRKNKKVFILLISLGVLPILRFFVLNNHSFLHCFFTYRALFVSVFAILMSAFLNMKNPFLRRAKR